jgi:hypothetical protein
MSLLRPRVMARQTRQLDVLGLVPPGMVMVSQVIGVRDVISGLSMVVLPAGRSRTVAVALRSTFDITDGLIFRRALADPALKRKVSVVAIGWGVVCAASGIVAAARP